MYVSTDFINFFSYHHAWKNLSALEMIINYLMFWDNSLNKILKENSISYHIKLQAKTSDKTFKQKNNYYSGFE